MPNKYGLDRHEAAFAGCNEIVSRCRIRAGGSSPPDRGAIPGEKEVVMGGSEGRRKEMGGFAKWP